MPASDNPICTCQLHTYFTKLISKTLRRRKICRLNESVALMYINF